MTLIYILVNGVYCGVYEREPGELHDLERRAALRQTFNGEPFERTPEPLPPATSVGELIRRGMAAVGYDRRQLAHRVNTNVEAVDTWTSNRKRPNRTNCERVAAVLGLDRRELLELAGYEAETPELRSV